jgi:uncharacterized protein YjiK
MSFTKENRVNIGENNDNRRISDTAGKELSLRKFECANIGFENCSKRRRGASGKSPSFPS